MSSIVVKICENNGKKPLTSIIDLDVLPTGTLTQHVDAAAIAHDLPSPVVSGNARLKTLIMISVSKLTIGDTRKGRV
jgi:hypothetical protein